MMIQRKIVLLTLILFQSFWLTADGQTAEPDISVLAQHAANLEGNENFEEMAKQLMAFLQDPKRADLNKEKLRFAEKKKKDTQVKQVSKEESSDCKFYDNYLSKYYPKVYVIREYFFENMEPEQIAKAMEDIVQVFTYEPWFYFIDKNKKEFSLPHYWEYIVDQLSLISEFLKNARVNLVTKEVYCPETTSGFGSRFGRQNSMPTQPSRNLYLYLKEHGHTVIFDFYALCFDYTIKLFNEGILLKTMDVVNRYYSDLEFIIKKLQDSAYEMDYQDAMKTCKELMNLLKTKLGVDSQAMIEEWFGDDEETKRMAQEAEELGMGWF